MSEKTFFKLVSLLLMVLFCAIPLTAGVKPVGLCYKLDGSIITNGGYDQETWSTLPAISGFIAGADSALVSIQIQTVVQMGWSDDALYISAMMLEPEMTHLVATDTGRDGKIWWDDCLEIFIDPNNQKKDYIHLIINSDGTCYDAIEKDKSWNGDWSVYATKLSDAWVLKLRIPFETLGVKPVAGDLWGVNYCRARSSSNKKFKGTGGTWADMKGEFHQPEKFGYLLFLEKTNKPSLKMFKEFPILKGQKVRVFMKDRYCDVNVDSDSFTCFDYIEQGQAELKISSKWVDKLETLDIEKASNKHKENLTLYLREYKLLYKSSCNVEPEAILQWVAGRQTSKQLSVEMEKLYWDILLEQSYKEISK